MENKSVQSIFERHFVRFLKLDEKEKKLLLTLCLEGPKTGYDLHSGRNKIFSSATWHYAHNSLEEKSLIEVKKEEPFRIRGKKRKFYGPTVTGVLRCIYYLFEDALTEVRGEQFFEEKMGKMSLKWGYLVPLVLGRWHIFNKRNLQDVRPALIASASEICRFYDIGKARGNVAYLLSYYFYREVLSYVFLNDTVQKEREKWLDLFVSDSEILEFAKDVVRKELESLRVALNEKEEISTMLNSLKGRDSTKTS